jgi:gluconate kinase
MELYGRQMARHHHHYNDGNQPKQSATGGAVNKIMESIRLTDEQRLDWLRLIRSQNVGPRGIMAQTPQAG